jgi:alpha-L-arabinofuranosidase
MFSAHRPDVTLKTRVSEPAQPEPEPGGRIGVGTWHTQAEYKDLRIEQNGNTLYQSEFAKGTGGWQLVSGEWQTGGGALRQTGGGNNLLAIAKGGSWTDYTMTLKARKIGGDEGFLILFNVKDAENMAHWNIGGWSNTRSTVEIKEGGANREIAKGPDLHIENNRWYDIKILVKGDRVECFLDGKSVQSAKLPPRGRQPGIFALGGRDDKSGQIILKAVNPGPDPLDTTIRINGSVKLRPTARVITLASAKPTDDNTLDEPNKVVPVESSFDGVGPEFKYFLMPYSLTIIRIDTAR